MIGNAHYVVLQNQILNQKQMVTKESCYSHRANGSRFGEAFSRTTGSTLFQSCQGCEKQYKQEETDLFKQLADYFTAVVPAVNEDASVEKIARGTSDRCR